MVALTWRWSDQRKETKQKKKKTNKKQNKIYANLHDVSGQKSTQIMFCLA